MDQVIWTYENGITTGKDDTHFAPGGVCTRAQVVTFLYRYSKLEQPEAELVAFFVRACTRYHAKKIAGLSCDLLMRIGYGFNNSSMDWAIWQTLWKGQSP